MAEIVDEGLDVFLSTPHAQLSDRDKADFESASALVDRLARHAEQRAKLQAVLKHRYPHEKFELVQRKN